MNSKYNKIYLYFSLFFIILSFFIIKSFLSGIIWAAIIALSIWPLFEHFHKKENKYFKTTSQSSLVFTFSLSVLLAVPFIYCIYELTYIYDIIVTYFAAHKNFIPVPEFIKYMPFHEKLTELWNKNIAYSSQLNRLFAKIETSHILDFFTIIWSGLMDRVITGLVMIVAFFFILKNGSIFKSHYQDFFIDTLGEKSVQHVDNAILALRGTINGVVLVGLIEGIMLSVPLLWAGFPSAFVIGLTAGILGVIPLLMPILIIPCLIYIYFSVSSVIAVIGFIDLAIVWFVFENLLKPAMISKKVKINSLIILMSMIGGMQLLGPVGLFTGPAIISMSIGLLKDLFKVEKCESKNDTNMIVNNQH